MMNGRAGQARIPQERAQPRRPDPPGPDVLVAVRPRAEQRARVVEVDAAGADPARSARRTDRSRRGSLRGRDVVAGAPQVRRVQAEGEAVTLGGRRRSRMAASSSMREPSRSPPPAEFSSTSRTAGRRVRPGPPDLVDDPAQARLGARRRGASRCACSRASRRRPAPAASRRQAHRRDWEANGSAEPARLIEVRGVDRDRRRSPRGRSTRRTRRHRAAAPAGGATRSGCR